MPAGRTRIALGCKTRRRATSREAQIARGFRELPAPRASQPAFLQRQPVRLGFVLSGPALRRPCPAGSLAVAEAIERIAAFDVETRSLAMGGSPPPHDARQSFHAC